MGVQEKEVKLASDGQEAGPVRGGIDRAQGRNWGSGRRAPWTVPDNQLAGGLWVESASRRHWSPWTLLLSVN